jgi:protocatechuate 3,4-dioxygenase beta subunit
MTKAPNMKTLFLTVLAVSHFVLIGCSQSQSASDKKAGGSCEDCQLMYEGMPGNLSWHTDLAGDNEPGEPLVISGTIFKRDGKTPASGVILYVYHTDHRGLYSPDPNQTKAKRHGHLRGWVKTDELGRYQIKTIRPASYPDSRNPQHIHPIIKEPGYSHYWIDDFLFDDDPLLTDQEKAHQQKRGGPGIISLQMNDKGVWIGKRDIILGLNIPGY